MGNIVITISWEPNKHDYLIKDKLRNLAISRGLDPDADPNNFYYNPKYTQFGVDISGIYLAIGRQNQLLKIQRFGEESIELLKNMNINNHYVHIENLFL